MEFKDRERWDPDWEERDGYQDSKAYLCKCIFSVGVHTSGEKVLYSMMIMEWGLGRVCLGTEASLEFNTVILRD